LGASSNIAKKIVKHCSLHLVGKVKYKKDENVRKEGKLG
jgi:hypothetical protein